MKNKQLAYELYKIQAGKENRAVSNTLRHIGDELRGGRAKHATELAILHATDIRDVFPEAYQLLVDNHFLKGGKK